MLFFPFGYLINLGHIDENIDSDSDKIPPHKVYVSVSYWDSRKLINFNRYFDEDSYSYLRLLKCVNLPGSE